MTVSEDKIDMLSNVVNAAAELTLHKLYARAAAGQDITVDVLTIATSIIGILVGVIGILQGYKFWKRRQKNSLTQLPTTAPDFLARRNVNDTAYVFIVLMCVASKPAHAVRPTAEELEMERGYGRYARS
ncbi:hypothetical protein P167DRAFT_571639 [Morchella conica CCBAS932]|uniref:Uncharacterized protein n=1 Tax=Morchella conica CCBAS932 TaxID=1392247 RepID=A0A3N4LAY5_9PEZI|nr:hypothetical protein P167DRAFT_571639 [Morchella conica CCBAS932]